MGLNYQSIRNQIPYHPNSDFIGRGFTLIELLVVISIVSLLISILLPALGAARKAAQGIKCNTQLKQIAMAGLMYTNDNDEWFAHRDRWFMEYGSTKASDATKGKSLGGTLRYMNLHHSGNDPTILTCPTMAPNYSVRTSIKNQRTMAVNARIGCFINENKTFTNSSTFPPWLLRQTLRITRASSTSFYMDGYPSVQDSSGWFYSGAISNSNVFDMYYPHNQANNVSFVDGHCQTVPMDQFQSEYASSDNYFWGGAY